MSVSEVLGQEGEIQLTRCRIRYRETTPCPPSSSQIHTGCVLGSTRPQPPTSYWNQLWCTDSTVYSWGSKWSATSAASFICTWAVGPASMSR